MDEEGQPGDAEERVTKRNSRESSPDLSTASTATINTYDHTHWGTQDPVRSPLDKPVRAKLVVGSVTTSESLVLYVFLTFFFFLPIGHY